MTNIAYKQYISELQKIYTTLQSQEEYSNMPYVGAKNAQGQPHGKGRMQYEDGSVYEGNFINGQKHGKGTFITAYGKKTDEEWEEGKLISGKGKIDLSEQGEYSGDINNGKRNGTGIMLYPDGHEFMKFDGCWENDLFNGEGFLTWASGDKYVGKWKDGKRHGKGTMTYSKKNSEGYLKYEGNWTDNQFSGKGKLTLLNGDIYDGEWRDGHNFNGKIFFENGDSYEGELKDKKKYGKGTYSYSNGEKYIGQWENDLENGKGILYNKDGGKKYDGEWKNGKKEGEGIQYNYEGEIREKGQFKKDKLYRGKLIDRSYDPYRELEGDFDYDGNLKNGVFKNGKTSVEVVNYRFVRGVLYDDYGKFEGELTGDIREEWPSPLNGYSNGYFIDGKLLTGEIRNQTLNGQGEAVFESPISGYILKFIYAGDIREEKCKMIKGYFTNGEVDGSCRMYFPCGFELEASGDGTGSISYQLSPDNQP